MTGVGGIGGGENQATFNIRGDMSEVTADIDKGIEKAAAKVDAAKEKSAKTVDEIEAKAKSAAEKAEISVRTITRRAFSEGMQTVRIIAQAAGWTKNQTYQMLAQGISTVASIISVASLAASTYAGIPGGQVMAAWQVGNAVAGGMLSISMNAQQAAQANNRDYLGDVFNGDDF